MLAARLGDVGNQRDHADAHVDELVDRGLHQRVIERHDHGCLALALERQDAARKTLRFEDVDLERLGSDAVVGHPVAVCADLFAQHRHEIVRARRQQETHSVRVGSRKPRGSRVGSVVEPVYSLIDACDRPRMNTSALVEHTIDSRLADVGFACDVTQRGAADVTLQCRRHVTSLMYVPHIGIRENPCTICLSCPDMKAPRGQRSALRTSRIWNAASMHFQDRACVGR